MPDVQTYTFSHRELLELMVKGSDLHEGEWMLTINFGLSAGNFGPTSEDVLPGGILLVQNIGITRAAIGSPKALTVDASVVNPRRSALPQT
jgi:hypothetical protein